MWLLKTDGSYELKEYISVIGRPEYAILSHVWVLDGEVSMKHIRDDLGKAKQMPGFRKIRKSCDTARRNGLKWIWIDTCCIDKTSSAELSEAINSMYAWYGEAKVCYAYLSDVKDCEEDPTDAESSFRRSRWFRRGWTLQELISPRSLDFFAENWESLGTKVSLADVLQKVTLIDRKVLLHDTLLEKVSIARRMSWAAQRDTTRAEDRAYSLMGIFNVNMPTMYGEGQRAFTRLQLEILRQSSDQSIFAWGTIHDHDNFVKHEPFFTSSLERPSERRSLLASSPDMFLHSADVEPIPLNSFVDTFKQRIPVLEYYPTNYGIRIHLPLITKRGTPNCFALLACRDGTHGIGLLLRRMDTTPLLDFASSRNNRRHQYYVGLHGGEEDHRGPSFRVFRLPRLPEDRRTLRERVVVTDMYLHSHNPNPERSLASQGSASSDTSRDLLRVRQAKPQKEFVFIFPGYLITRLQKQGFKLDRNKNVPGYTPVKMWSCSEGGSQLKLTLSTHASPPQAVVLFRGPKEAFALAIGVTPAGHAWADGLVKGNEGSEDGDWQGSAHDAAKRIWSKYSDVGSAEDFSMTSWNHYTRVFGNDTSAVRVTFKPLVAVEEQVEGRVRVRCECNIELIGTAHGPQRSRKPSLLVDAANNLADTAVESKACANGRMYLT
ncbi:HET-domain-containing protein [Lentinus brumalis]|uniref:HET-domain-containing protein n=1 Tax=Lentinus brumalis TaxID=2498619 RepID=A0A371CMC0_9APHY|nr:HET-domain-containing protein [Polyporus brumalis]